MTAGVRGGRCAGWLVRVKAGRGGGISEQSEGYNPRGANDWALIRGHISVIGASNRLLVLTLALTILKHYYTQK